MVTLPEIPTLPHTIQLSPMVTLWPICTWLSILVPRPIRVDLERGAVDGGAGADFHVVADHDIAERMDPRQRHVGREGRRRHQVGREAETVGADHRIGMHDHPVADRAAVADAHAGMEQPCAPIVTSAPIVTCGMIAVPAPMRLRGPTTA